MAGNEKAHEMYCLTTIPGRHERENIRNPFYHVNPS